MKYSILTEIGEIIIDADMTSITNNGDLLLLRVYDKDGKEEKDLLLALAKYQWKKVENIENKKYIG